MSNKHLRREDVPFYRYWQAFYLSFFSKKLYIDVVKRWHGYGVLYFLCVLLVASIPLSLRILVDFNKHFDQQMIDPISKLPPISIQNGQTSIKEKSPYFVKNSNEAVVAIVDPSGNIKFDNSYPELALLVSKNKIYFRPPQFKLFLSGSAQTIGRKIFVQDLSKKQNEIFSGSDWIKRSGILKLKLITDLLIYPLIVGFIFSVFIIFMLFLALLGQLFALSILKVKLTYSESSRLFFVATTPVMFLFFILLATNFVPPGIGFVYIGLLAIYFFYAVLSVKKDRTKMVHA